MKKKILQMIIGIPLLIWYVFCLVLLGILFIAFSLDILEDKMLSRYPRRIKNKWE